MRRAFLLAVTAAYGLLFSPISSAQTTFPQQHLYAQASTKQSGCEMFYALQPIDANVLKLLGAPAVPSNPNLLTSPEYIRQRDWDFPSKVTAWTERPKPEEIARQRDALVAGSNPSASKDKSKNAPTAASGWALRTYGLEPFSSHDWNDLQKWFAKEAPKKIPGLCVDPANAAYVVVLGVIVLGTGDASLDSASARIQYDQSTRQAESSVGPNSATATLGGSNRPAQELTGMSTSSRPGTRTCVYLFRTGGENSARMDAPDYYYCRSSDDAPRAALTAMLKHIAKPGAN